MFGIVLFIIVIGSWISLLLGVIRASQAGTDKYLKDRVFWVKTFWLLAVGTILWFLVGAARYFMDLASWGYFVIAVGLLIETLSFYSKIKAMPRK